MASRGKNRLLTTSGVADILHLHINTVRRWSNQGILKPYRIGPRGDRRFMRDDVLNFLATQQYAYKNWEIKKEDITQINTQPVDATPSLNRAV
jgi:excisionase family DNA binding protein